MNTSELKPIDARVMKPGDPVVREDGTPGRFVVHIPEAHAAFRAVFMFDGNMLPTLYTEDGRVDEGGQRKIFLPPDPDPIDPSPGNVDKLRKSQIPEGHRIPAHDEKPDRRAKCWRNGKWNARNHSGAYEACATYLVPIAPVRMVPLSMEDFVGKPWPLVKAENTCEIWTPTTMSDDGVFGQLAGFASFSQLRENYFVSWDHGVTWVKAEKEEQPQQPISPGHP